MGTACKQERLVHGNAACCSRVHHNTAGKQTTATPQCRGCQPPFHDMVAEPPTYKSVSFNQILKNITKLVNHRKAQHNRTYRINNDYNANDDSDQHTFCQHPDCDNMSEHTHTHKNTGQSKSTSKKHDVVFHTENLSWYRHPHDDPKRHGGMQACAHITVPMATNSSEHRREKIDHEEG